MMPYTELPKTPRVLKTIDVGTQHSRVFLAFVRLKPQPRVAVIRIQQTPQHLEVPSVLLHHTHQPERLKILHGVVYPYRQLLGGQKAGQGIEGRRKAAVQWLRGPVRSCKTRGDRKRRTAYRYRRQRREVAPRGQLRKDVSARFTYPRLVV